jgi:TolB protein
MGCFEPSKRIAVIVKTTLVLLLAMTTSRALGAGEPGRRLTSDGLLKRDPIYVDGGKAVLYSVRHASPRLVLKRLNLETGESSRFHPKSSLVEFRPGISADGETLAFQRMTGNDVCSLIVEDLKAGTEQTIATNRKTSWNATLSPDGRELIYNLSGQLYRRNIASGKEEPIARSGGRNDWPAYSPDGTTVAFASSRDGDFDLFLMDREGDNVRLLTSGVGLDMRPSWSPDSRRIAFTSNRDGNYEIYLIQADGSQLRRLTEHDERDDYAAWHPDGKRLVYVAERNGRFDLFELLVGD